MAVDLAGAEQKRGGCREAGVCAQTERDGEMTRRPAVTAQGPPGSWDGLNEEGRRLRSSEQERITQDADSNAGWGAGTRRPEGHASRCLRSCGQRTKAALHVFSGWKKEAE